MDLSKEDMKLEEQYLKKTIDEIDSQIESMGSDIFTEKEDLLEFQRMMWENKHEMDVMEMNSNIQSQQVKYNLLDERVKKFHRLNKIKPNPYFGSIVFNKEPIYIGITAVKKDMDYLICDWRAPICSLFYDYGVGPARYESPGGFEEGTITRKRQYKIEKGKLKHVFDTNVNIDDELLQDVLAQSSGEKMKNIVNTIQAEQNDVIRNNKDKNLIVQGIAGSGKTSVALHRIAYLLYKLEYLCSGNVLVFSPNQVFTEYISDVLPDLGEQNTVQTTFHEFASTFIQEYENVEPYSTFVERYYKGKKQDNDLIRFKLSDEMIHVMDEFISYYAKASRFLKDLEYKKTVVDMYELNDLLHIRYADRPLFDRVDLIAEHINNRYLKGNEKEVPNIRKALLKIANFSSDYRKIYQAFFESAIFKRHYKFDYLANENRRGIEQNQIRYEDSTLFIYMKCLLEGYPYQVAMRQVVIDEAQDYTYLQYQIIRKIFKNADFTILGDVNQTVNPFYKYDNLNVLMNIFDDSRYFELTKTYRSSPEIIEYANSILGLNHVSAIRRKNQLPVIKRDMHDIQHIGKDLKYLIEKYKSVALITKSIDESRVLYDQFKEKYKYITIIDANTKKYKNDLIVAPAYSVKGLEFDACIIINNFINDSYLYYVAVTRAQHELIVYE